MLDLQLIPTLPTLKDLLGPDWETHTLRDAREAVAFTSMRQRWPRDLDRQVVESLRAFGLYAPRNYHAVNETLRELGQWREVLQAGVKISGAGPLRRQILNRFFEVADAPVPPESEDLRPETELPTLAELLGPEWEACDWEDAVEAMRAWWRINPSPHGLLAIRALTSTRRFAASTMGGARDELLAAIAAWGRPTARQIGPKSGRVLCHLFGITETPGAYQPTEASLKTQAERLLRLYDSLPAASQHAWIKLGQRMLPDSEDGTPTELTDIHPRLNRDQIALWLDLGEQMLQRATREDA